MVSDLPANPDRRAGRGVEAVSWDGSGISGTMDVEDTFGHLTVTTREEQTFVNHAERACVSTNLHL